MDNVWTNLGNRLETAWKRPTRPNSKRPKDGEIIDEEKSVRWNREEVVRRQKAYDRGHAYGFADIYCAIEDYEELVVAVLTNAR